MNQITYALVSSKVLTSETRVDFNFIISSCDHFGSDSDVSKVHNLFYQSPKSLYSESLYDQSSEFDLINFIHHLGLFRFCTIQDLACSESSLLNFRLAQILLYLDSSLSIVCTLNKLLEYEIIILRFFIINTHV